MLKKEKEKNNMKSVEISKISTSKVNERVIEVSLEAVSQFTGEIYEAKGYARCSSKDEFDFEIGKDIAIVRAERKILQKMERDYRTFIAKPYIVNPNELYYRKCINQLLAIHDDLQFVNRLVLTMEN